MDEPSKEQTTQVLRAIRDGDRDSADRLFPLVYEQLRALAGSYFRTERADHTLQPTALVHEAFVRMVNADGVEWRDRAHFFALAATAMRRILTDHARKNRAAKRGGDWDRISHPADATPVEMQMDVIALDEALSQLEAFDERKHRVLQLRFFGGLTVEEVAEVLGVSKTTVESEWRTARAWLKATLEKDDANGS